MVKACAWPSVSFHWRLRWIRWIHRVSTGILEVNKKAFVWQCVVRHALCCTYTQSAVDESQSAGI